MRTDQNEATVRLALSIRAFELALIDLARAGLTAGPVHSSLGHEIVAVATCRFLEPHDAVLPYYRSHAWLIARGVDPVALLRSCCEDGARTMHLDDANGRVLPGNAYVAQQLPVALGLSANIRVSTGRDSIVLASVGDGGAATGLAFEAMLCSAARPHPLLIIVEDNGLQNYGRSATIVPHFSLERLCEAAGVHYVGTSGAAIARDLSVVEEAVRRLRSRSEALVLHVRCHLEHPHSVSAHGTVVAEGTNPTQPQLISQTIAELSSATGLPRRRMEAIARQCQHSLNAVRDELMSALEPKVSDLL